MAVELSIMESGVLAAFEKSGCEWNRSKIMIVGEGRAGKTAFSRSLVGDAFADTDSTRGINQLTCVVSQLSVSGVDSLWHKSLDRHNEYEAAIARSIIQAKDNLSIEKERSILGSTSLRESRQVNEIDNRSAFHALSDDTDNSRVTAEKSSSLSTTMPVKLITSNSATSTGVQTESTASSTTTSNATAFGTTAAPVTDANVNTDVEKKDSTMKRRQPDEELLVKCLADNVQTSSSFHISVFDYGGQEVFAVIHHLFLTEYGVYALCFNMEWLLAEDETEKERCLKYLQFWIDSIYMHTYNTKTERCAPFILIGTHKDRFPKPEDHHTIDFILNEAFKTSNSWSFKLENKEAKGKSDARTTLCFFAVDNKLGRDDATLVQAMRCMEKAMDEAEYTHIKVPLEWLALIDSLKETKKSFFELSEFTQIAIECGVVEDHIPLILKFMHEMGKCMYIDEPALKDLVIMDAVEYLVNPASMVICNHSGNVDDKTRHVLPSDIMSEVSKLSVHSKWMDLVNAGILSKSLLPLLWKDRLSDVDRLLSLMVQYGLLVPLISDESIDDLQYVVPSLLPTCPDPDFNDMVGNWGDQSEASSCYLFFTLSKVVEKKPELNCSTLKGDGFCPSGLFERILGKIVIWTQATSKEGLWNPEMIALFKEVSVLSFGSRSFRLTASPNLKRLNCIRVDVQGSNPLVVVLKIVELVEQVIKESMKGLSVMILLPKVDSSRSHLESIRLLEQSDDPSSSLIPLVAIKKAVESNTALKHQSKTVLSLDVLKRCYGPWLQVYAAKDCYDLFISYRWNDYDQPLARQVFDSMSNYDLHGCSIDIFLDVLRLKMGKQFDKEFVRALINSSVVMPLISMEAVENMKKHNKDIVDHVLLEWMLSYECVAANKRNPNLSRVQSIFPIYFGHRHKVNESNSLRIDSFDYKFHMELPDVAPEATIAKVKESLIANGIDSFTDKLEFWTVRSFMGEFKTFLGAQGSEFSYRRLVSSIAGRAHEVLQEQNSRPPSRVTTKLRKAVATAVDYGDDLTQWLTSTLGNISDEATSLIDKLNENELLTVQDIKDAIACDLLTKKDVIDLCKESGMKVGSITKITKSLDL